MEDQEKLFEYLKRAAAELQETRRRLRRLEAGELEPIAILGMGCRFPGSVQDPEGLWDLLAAGGDAISEIPASRGWDLGVLYDPDPDHAGTSYVMAGGFVDAAQFDAGFFGISPREALAMDPQQRLLLEVSWEALEQAGINPKSLRGSPTGVFAGASSSGYGIGPQSEEGYLVAGTATSVISGRVAYTLGLEGPALTVDTACSSSLVALHLAGQALRAGECSLALAGGVMVMATPGVLLGFSRQRALAADGRCKAFGAAADGMGLAEGAGVLVVERLSDALRNGHPVLAVVRGSAVNSDGASNGLTAPNGPSQRRVIEAALENARLTADQVDAVEAHGTGTELGDPIEAQALMATYGQGRQSGRPLLVGSVKSNIGHAQCAAGMAGVMKVVLALRHHVLPQTLHAEAASPHIDWSEGTVRLLTEAVPWTANGHPRRVGVSSFGLSGTNAHLVIEESPAADHGPVTETDGPVPVLLPRVPAWVVSARSAAGLAAQASRLAGFLAARPELDPDDVAWSLATTRSVFEHRAVITGTSREHLAAGLAAVTAGEPAAGLVTGEAGDAGRVVFVFPGQGGQWAGMGQDLAAASPVFASRLAECERALAPYVDFSFGDELDLDRVDVVQPALWAVMVSLAAVWEAAGVTPDAVAGHSQGEIAAACVAGMLSLEDAARVVALRSRALVPLAGRGGMVSVAEPLAAVVERLAGFGDRLCVAAVNGPAATVVSGEPAAVAELAASCEAAGVRARVLGVDYASHSVQVEDIREDILSALGGITPGHGRVPMVSAMSGELVQGPELDAGYWYASLRSRVGFDQAVRVLAADGPAAFIEVSPHPVLTGAITSTLEDAGVPAPVVAGTLRRDDGGPSRFLTSLAEVFVRGAGADWPAVLGHRRRVQLPTYAFQHERFWPESPPARAGGNVASMGLDAMSHPLLGAAVEVAAGQGLVFTGRLSVRDQPWLADHAVAGMMLLPGTAFVELALVAGHRAGCGRIEELTLEAPLVVPDPGEIRIQVIVGGVTDGGRRPIEVYSRHSDEAPGGPWTRHASGMLASPDASAEAARDLTVWPPAGAVPVDVARFYDRLAAGGYGYGPAFHGLRVAWRRGQEVFAEVALPEAAAAEAGSFGIHPALLDAALHTIALAETASGGMLLPFAWTGISLHAAAATALRVRLRPDGADGWTLAIADTTGAQVAAIGSLVTRPVTAGQLEAARGGPRDALFSVDWVPLPARTDEAVSHWAVLGGRSADVVTALSEAGARVTAYSGAAALAEAIEAGEPAPDAVLSCAGTADDSTATEAAHRAAVYALALVQRWLAADRLAGLPLLVLTRGAQSTSPEEDVADLAGAAVSGLVRSVQSENPGRVILVDLPARTAEADGADLVAALTAALRSGEADMAVRGQTVSARRLTRPADTPLVPPEDGPWRLDIADKGSLEGLALVACPEAGAPLEAGQVRVAVRAAGLNFRDVAVALGLVGQDTRRMGSDVAGIVIETGPGVSGLAAGDRVLGITEGGFGPLLVTSERSLAPIPGGWSFARAASVPVAFVTAWYALVELARARAGQRLLVHAAAGGVGMAAMAIARHLGLEVYGTASPGKWATLAGMGLDSDHVASSRTAEFEPRFLAATGGAGMDIVLNSLAGEFTDASLRLLPGGGAFIEMGKTGLRDAAQVAADHPGVAYRAFDLSEAGSGRLSQILAEVTGLLDSGDLAPLPVTTWDVRQAPDAFRFMTRARHTGKIVLTIPPDPVAPRKGGTALITGGTGMLGGLMARHLAARGLRHVLLASRSGPAAPGTAALAASVASRGARVQVTACDAADRDALAGLLGHIPEDVPLTWVVHAAGVLDDGVIESLTPERVRAVMLPKADAAWHLHELTAGHDLEAFALFSSAAATFGAAGQGNYAAANAFLDGLACHRRAAGLPATSLAWGLWADASAMTGHLDTKDRARMTRGGVGALTSEEGLQLLDLAVARAEPVLAPVLLDVAWLRDQAAHGGAAALPAVLRDLAGRSPRRVTPASPETGADAAGALRVRLAVLPVPDRDQMVTDMIRRHAAAVLGHSSAEAVGTERPFKEQGFDSLTALELRNRLGAATGLRLPATLIFDYPTPVVLARHLRREIVPDGEISSAFALEEMGKLEKIVQGLAADDNVRPALAIRVKALLTVLESAHDVAAAGHADDDIKKATAENIFDLLDKEFGDL
jgi:acyl transferase domain-containing protein/NADPH:quinone reductase-like Zn-dependent oxidoreductase/NAD(P)-dependent dehydrogenase (short-subunit alcohol dehydrogenase family)/acyl carrier protein